MYTKHALHQMTKRSITKAQISQAIANGHAMINKNDSNKRTIIDNTQRLYVVTNDIKTIVITAFWAN